MQQPFRLLSIVEQDGESTTSLQQIKVESWRIVDADRVVVVDSDGNLKRVLKDRRGLEGSEIPPFWVA